MKTKHLLRTDKMLLLSHVLTAVFLLVGLMAQLKMSGLPEYISIIPMVVDVIVLIIGIVSFVLWKGTLKYSRVVGIAFAVLYVVILMTATSGITFPYMIPFLVILMLTMDKPVLVIDCIVFASINLIRIIISIATCTDINDVIELAMIEFIISLLLTCILILGVNLITKFFEESTGEIQAASDNNNQITHKIIDVAGRVELEAENAKRNTMDIYTATQDVNESMSDVARGVTSTTEAIAKQTEQTKAIQAIIDETHDKTKQIVHITEDTKRALDQGAEAMQKLMEHMNNSVADREVMREAANMLKNKTNEVRGITDIILGISSQTNLLALNASIEAARAGETGRGFAVVADEIRNLAEQTRMETENITGLLDELIKDAQAVTDKVDGNAEVSEKESQLADEANKQFADIEQKIDTLSADIAKVNDMMNELLSSNNMIVESVNTLSSISDGISESTQRAYDNSKANVGLVQEFTKTMEHITAQIAELKQFQ